MSNDLQRSLSWSNGVQEGSVYTPRTKLSIVYCAPMYKELVALPLAEMYLIHLDKDTILNLLIVTKNITFCMLAHDQNKYTNQSVWFSGIRDLNYPIYFTKKYYFVKLSLIIILKFVKQKT